MNRFSIRRALVVWLATVVLPAGAGAQSPSLSEATIADINAAFDAGSLTSERLVELYLARIDAYDGRGPKLNVILTLNPQALEMIVRLNGEEVQHGYTEEMLFTFAEIVSYISQQITMQPGDLVFSGSTGVTVALKDGDLVEVEIPGIGVLSNPVVREKA